MKVRCGWVVKKQYKIASVCVKAYFHVLKQVLEKKTNSNTIAAHMEALSYQQGERAWASKYLSLVKNYLLEKGI